MASEITDILTVKDRNRIKVFIKSLELIEEEEIKLIYNSWKPAPLFYIGYLIFTDYSMIFLHSEPTIEQPKKTLQIPLDKITEVKEKKYSFTEHIVVKTKKETYDFGVFTGFLKERKAPSNIKEVVDEIMTLIKK